MATKIQQILELDPKSKMLFSEWLTTHGLSTKSNIKAIRFCLLSLALATLLFSCKGKETIENTYTDASIQTFCFADSCEHLTMKVSLELPAGKDSVSFVMRDSLVAEFIRSICNPITSEGSSIIPPCTYDRNDIQALVDYYGHAVYEHLLRMAVNDYNDRISYLAEDTTMTNEERERIKKDIPQWELDLAITKTIDTQTFVVYNSQTFCYYGGAHGGVTGSGPITFNKVDGHRIEHFLLDDAALTLQAYIRKGLLQYYRESCDTISDTQLSDRLQIEGEVIPLPQRSPTLNATADSLIFTYGQYEIASYADGMPSFSLPIKEISNLLTSEVKSLLLK